MVGVSWGATSFTVASFSVCTCLVLFTCFYLSLLVFFFFCCILHFCAFPCVYWSVHVVCGVMWEIRGGVRDLMPGIQSCVPTRRHGSNGMTNCSNNSRGNTSRSGCRRSSSSRNNTNRCWGGVGDGSSVTAVRGFKLSQIVLSFLLLSCLLPFTSTSSLRRVSWHIVKGGRVQGNDGKKGTKIGSPSRQPASRANASGPLQPGHHNQVIEDRSCTLNYEYNRENT